MKKYGILTFSVFSILTLLLVSCGRGQDNILKMDTFDVVMSIFFVLLLAIVVGVFVYFIVKHFRQ
ncbi:MAG: hypothetical protein IJM36_01320 [Acholeplasmatales bacterium]|nr:hypothetical protein [Acholeplasmatales bacterium]